MKEYSPVLLDNNKEDVQGKGNSKVSQIATMFQGGGVDVDPAPPLKNPCPSVPEPSGPNPSHVSVVRTESHVARFNTARALFEKMSEQSGFEGKQRSLKSPPGSFSFPGSRMTSPGAGSSSSSTVRGGGGGSLSSTSSRSPSPGSSAILGHLHSNGHHHPNASRSPPLATSINTLSSTIPTLSPSSNPTVATSGCSFYSPSPPPTFTSDTTSERDLVSLRRCSTPSENPHHHHHTAHPSDASTSKIEKPEPIFKPEKPVKPDSLRDRRSAHQQNQERIQRHKNWFQSFSKAKSPITSPVKTVAPPLDSGSVAKLLAKTDPHFESESNFWQRASETDSTDPEERPTTNQSKLTEQDPASPPPSTATVHSDWRKERAGILSGRTSLQQGNESNKSQPASVERFKSFEEVSTLPSSWCPPKQYNIQSIPTSTQKQEESTISKTSKGNSNVLETGAPKKPSSTSDDTSVASSQSHSRNISGSSSQTHSCTTSVSSSLADTGGMVMLEKKGADLIVTESVILKDLTKEKDFASSSRGSHINNRDQPTPTTTPEGVILRKPVVRSKWSNEEVNFRLKESSTASVKCVSYYSSRESEHVDRPLSSTLQGHAAPTHIEPFESDREKRLKEWERRKENRLSGEVKGTPCNIRSKIEEPEVHGENSQESLKDIRGSRSFDDILTRKKPEKSDKIYRIMPAGVENVVKESRVSQSKSKNDEVIWVKREDDKTQRRDSRDSFTKSLDNLNGIEDKQRFRRSGSREEIEERGGTLPSRRKAEQRAKIAELEWSGSLDRKSKSGLKRKSQEEYDRRRQEEMRKKLEEEALIRKIMEEKERKQEEFERKRLSDIEKRRQELERQRREYEKADALKEEKEKEKRRKEELEKRRVEEIERRKIEELERKLLEEKEKRKRDLEKQRQIEKQQQEELEKKKREELERKLELERQRQLEKEKKIQEEVERKRKEEWERRREEELEEQRLQEIDRRRQEELERQRQEELERKRQKELERKRQEELERKRQEELERKRQEELERKKEKELEKKRQEELERKREEELERMRQKELERKREEELEIKKQEELERQGQKKFEIQRQEELERERQIQRLKEMEDKKEEELEVKETDVMERLNVEELNKEKGFENIREELANYPEQGMKIDDEMYPRQNKDIDTEKASRAEDISKLYEERRKVALIKWEEEEQARREKDRQEILKTKQRIAELKKEREEIRRQQAYRMQQLLEGPPAADNDDATAKDDKNFNSNDDKDYLLDDESDECEKGLKDGRGKEDEAEEIMYDHTVLSAQHKIQFCVSPHGSASDTVFKEATEADEAPPATPPSQHAYNTISTIASSEYEPLPPPIPPHNVDPALLLQTSIDHDSSGSVIPTQEMVPSHEAPSVPAHVSAMVPAVVDEPSVMTPEEEQRLLSHKNNQHRTVLTDSEASEVRELLNSSSDGPISTTGVSAPVDVPFAGDNLDGGLCSRPSGGGEVEEGVVSPHTPEGGAPPYESQGGDEEYVPRAQEILVEDGFHYLEDGHYWVEVPGLTEDDDEDYPSHVPYHKHTKLKFSKEPIQQFSTYSVTDYDRKNEDVDPVAASAEYELEKRVEKMDVFPVDIDKGESGLGLSIIGMGVGADAGVEKLGIFVKTITPGGATDTDGRIEVNDQIIEVDDQSLVGVTQAFAGSVLKNTSGHVRFLIGREKDPENSEVAMLIRQSLMADMEREERRRALGGPDYSPHDGIFESLSSPSESCPPDNISRNNYSSHYDEVATEVELGICSDPLRRGSPPHEAFNPNVEISELSHSNEVLILRHHLQEVQQRNEMFEEEITLLRNKITDLESLAIEKEDLCDNLEETRTKLKFIEEELQSRQAEVATYQDMLEQSQGQYIVLEKKYYKAKKIIKEYQSRERDFLHREEYHITQMEEKDSHYNSLVRALKDRVIQLEGDLMKAQQKAGLPIRVPPDQIPVSLTEGPPKELFSQMEPPLKPSTLASLEDELSDTEGGDQPNSEDSKSSTVERKVPPKEELDVAVPPHQLLDVSASKAKSELASRGGLAHRQLPSLKKTGSQSSTSSFERSLEESAIDNVENVTESFSHPSNISTATTSTNTKVTSSTSPPHSELFHYHPHSSPLHLSSDTTPIGRQPPPYQPPPYQPPPSAPLTHRPLTTPGQDWSNSSLSSHHRNDSGSGRPEIPYRHPPPIARVQPVNRVDIGESSSTSNSTVAAPQNFKNQQQQQTLAEQLKSLLSERETYGDVPTSDEGHQDGSPIKVSPTSLMDDVRQAIMQADINLGKKPYISGPMHLSSTAQVVSAGHLVQRAPSPQKPTGPSFPPKINRDSGSWSPKSGRKSNNLPSVGIHSQNNSGVVLLSQRPIDPSLPPYQRTTEDMSIKQSDNHGASFGIPEDNSSTVSNESRILGDRSTNGDFIRETTAVMDWSSEQVAHWLMTQGLESCVPKFMQSGITGPRLINLDTKDLKNFNLTTDEKNKIKKKVKDLRLSIEKEKKQLEREKKEREKLQKKAEKLAEKAEKRKR